MNYAKLLFIVVFTILISSCGGRNSSYTDDSGYEDGTYSAEIEYYNPETGTSSTYTLDVEIEDNELTVIHWPNGGWLDDSHFTPPDISSGYAEFTSDRGVDYEVTILDDKDCTPDYVAKDEDELIEVAQEEICPKCGNEKYSWKKYCNRCTDELENTCSQCGGFEYSVNGGICGDCKNNSSLSL